MRTLYRNLWIFRYDYSNVNKMTFNNHNIMYDTPFETYSHVDKHEGGHSGRQRPQRRHQGRWRRQLMQ